MSDLMPIPTLPPAPPTPAGQPSWWWRLTHRRTTRAARQARLLADHHAWTTERARAAQIDLVRAGFHLGPVPLGYRPRRITELGTDGRVRQGIRLVIAPGPAYIIGTIYQWRVQDELSPRAIATRLRSVHNHRLVPLVSPATGRPWQLTSTNVARILANPVYTGATVWGRTHAGQPVPPDQWVVCPYAHQPIIDGRTFFRAQLLATPETAIISPHLPPWEFPAAPTGEPGNDSGSHGAVT
ncbi:recombinase [Frankia sp. B2]|uniref:recombinase family protein n=1 Tax=unclassified Frankia TaxID=2632575 RepID=UPI0006CA1632|nr:MULTISPECIES: recombinase family protein [unclassified Frankia]KPM51487.1 recombinase [Frankia sp. R43]TFE26514.1 recombinase [Frankia sp. B2]